MTKNRRILILIAIVTIMVTCTLCLTQQNSVAFADTNEEYIYLGGVPIGINAVTDGLLLTKFVYFDTDKGKVCPAEEGGLNVGDLIIKVDNIPVYNVKNIGKYIENKKGYVTFTINDNGKSKNVNVMPYYDKEAKVNKTGMMLKNNVTGIGTLTYVTESGKYGALGHFVTDAYGYNSIYSKGEIFDAKIQSFVKGEKGKAGELKGEILINKPIGNIKKNSISGLNGSLYNKESNSRSKFLLGDKSDVEPGKAMIFTTIDENPPKFYEIEIIKKENQNFIEDKSMVIRVTDKELLEKTGGILQGMSGSPIIQNNKLIGAVTHVFINNPSLGYGIYINWMKN